MGKKKDGHKYWHSYSDRLSTRDGDGTSESWFLPSMSMVVRSDENDEQCQSQERNKDECGVRKIDGFWYVGSQLSPPEQWWQKWDYGIKRVCWEKEGTASTTVGTMKPTSPSPRACHVPGCAVQVTILFNFYHDCMNSHYYHRAQVADGDIEVQNNWTATVG